MASWACGRTRGCRGARPRPGTGDRPRRASSGSREPPCRRPRPSGRWICRSGRSRDRRDRPGQDLLHLERLPGATGDDGLRPLVNGLTLLAPELLLRLHAPWSSRASGTSPNAATSSLDDSISPERQGCPAQLHSSRGRTTTISAGTTSQSRLARSVRTRSLPSGRQRAALSLTDKTTSSIGPVMSTKPDLEESARPGRPRPACPPRRTSMLITEGATAGDRTHHGERARVVELAVR